MKGSETHCLVFRKPFRSDEMCNKYWYSKSLNVTSA